MTQNNYLKKELYTLIKEEESIFDFIQESSLDGLWYWDIEKPENEWMNAKFWTTLGYNPDEMPHLSSAWQNIINQDDLKLALDNFSKHLENPNHPYDQIVRYTHQNNSIVWIRCRGMAIRNEKGKPIRMLGAHQDITEQKEIEEKLILLNADKDRFISILGHDLRSPFNAMLGLTEELLENFHEYHIDEIKNMVGDINKSAKRSFNLLEDILIWARAQKGNIPFKPQNLSLNDVCHDVLITLNTTAKEKNISINCSLAKHREVFADIDMLKAVLRNLVSNAIKFTNSGGVIDISGVQSDSNMTVSVSDNGVGISSDDQAKLFDISEVLTAKGTANETGTGLGLLLCKEFVEKHSGKIWVESEVEKGSQFKFTLPLQ